jgi:hypothetical protein
VIFANYGVGLPSTFCDTLTATSNMEAKVDFWLRLILRISALPCVSRHYAADGAFSAAELNSHIGH